MKHKNIIEDIITELTAGIVEIVYTDSYSVEYTISAHKELTRAIEQFIEDNKFLCSLLFIQND